jgi:hypothetical protein
MIGNISLNDIPNNVVIYYHGAVGHSVPSPNDLTPRNLRMGFVDMVWDIVCVLTDQFDITQGGVVGTPIGDEVIPFQPVSVK